MYIFKKILVVVPVLQILRILTSISAQKVPSLLPISDKTNLQTNNNLDELSHKNSEGMAEGGTIELRTKPPDSTHQSHNREGAVNEILHTKNITTLPLNTTSANSTTSLKLQVNPSTTSTTERNIPVSENKPPKETSHRPKILARKGVNYTEFAEQQSKLNVTTVKPKPKKPTVTEGGEEPYAPSHFQSGTKSNSSAAQSIPKVPAMLYSNNQGNTQKYVVPIVIVILSVPFVAILISILYKRGAEWWRYRHYRRMDFLINGMYDN